ncbi:TIGR02281 family clan AA aspartic protease [uncultured Cohaesibacter sp.]|uniref:TIGR02281 family clan AA aspartic protease n=1 Tax=uncultured Cohaesibacter sp. TaxID=1002546 RepID=UPI002930D060|nr:TIGR02281 family clan AA aspartic protease [uncultured Cohaesibacter sp.]
MARIVLFALLAIAVFVTLPGLATDWLVKNGYMEQTEDGALSPSDDQILSAGEPSDSSSGSAGYHRVVLKPGRGGHYYASAFFNNKKIRVLIDSGATLVSLTNKDARRLGLAPQKSDYTAKVRTANGLVHYARAHVRTIRIGSVKVHDVDVLIAPEGALDQTLMGMSFLRKLKTLKMEHGRLILGS